ncbi:MAG: site-2 protease family protein [bacterium]|nr:site-2 protease family protein [bacterium]
MLESLLSKFIALFVIVIAIALHEFGHAAMATKLGDPTPRLQGRLTLNPAAHFDPIGFLFIMFTVFVGFGIGWGKPVQTNPLYYDNTRNGIILTALAGPAMNACLAMFGIGSTYILFLSGVELVPLAHTFILLWVIINIGLIAFNMLPIPPLDGGHLLQQLAPRFMEPVVRFLQTFGMLIVLGMVFLGLTGPIIGAVFGAVIWMIQAAFGREFVGYLFQGLG